MLTKCEVEQIPVVLKIRAHEQQMLEDKPPCGLEQCPKCRAVQEDPRAFCRHEIRKRTFLVPLGNLVYAIRSCLSRWLCPLCSATFTVYPPFALPFKRYVLPEICARSRRYIEHDDLSYRRAVLENRRPVFRAADEPSQIDERALAPSTLHRWIATLSRLPQTLRTALDLIKQAAPDNGLFRQLAAVGIHPRKYRGEARRGALLRCGQLLMAAGPYKRIFGRPVFPNLATASAWG